MATLDRTFIPPQLCYISNDTVPKIFHQLVATYDWDHLIHKFRDDSQHYLSPSNYIAEGGRDS